MLRGVRRRLVFVGDADPGLAVAFISAFADRIAAATADVISVSFNKGMSNDNQAVAAGRQNLCYAIGVTPTELDAMKADELYEKAIDDDPWLSPG